MKRSHSIKEQHKEQHKERTDTNEEQQRRSTRLAKKEKVDYKELNNGEKFIENAGTSEVAKHMMENAHTKEDMELEILDYENNWYKRGVKEAIQIRRHHPTLNIDQGRYYISPIWNKNICKNLNKSIVENSKIKKFESKEIKETEGIDFTPEDD